MRRDILRILNECHVRVGFGGISADGIVGILALMLLLAALMIFGVSIRELFLSA